MIKKVIYKIGPKTYDKFILDPKYVKEYDEKTNFITIETIDQVKQLINLYGTK